MRGIRAAKFVPAALMTGCLGYALLGCSTERDAMAKRLDALEDEVTLLQNENDRLVGRVSGLEAARRAPAVPPTTTATDAAPAEPGRPALRVVKLAPEPAAPPPSEGPEPAGSAKPAAEEPRPVIQGSGQKLEAVIPPQPTSALPRRARQRGVRQTEVRVERV